MVNEEVYALLLAEVEEASRAHNAARDNFWRIAGQPRELPRFPTGLPHPDGSELIRNAVREENFARQSHVEAVIRLNRYLLDGRIPEDMPEKLRTAQAVG
jgi:hypothetical protein